MAEKGIVAVPESVLKKQKRNEEWALQKKEEQVALKKKNVENHKLIFNRAKQYSKEYEDQMDHSISDELYSEALKVSSGELGTYSQAYHNHLGSHDKEVDDNDEDEDDGSIWGELEEQNGQLELDREWQKRRDQFHTIGYRDGLTAGKEASAQEGFNEGFKESVVVGYRWGLVRGVTTAFSCLSEGLRKKMVESQEDISHFKSLYESVSSLSTKDALKTFHESLGAKIVAEHSERPGASADVAYSKDENPNILQNYFEELKLLIHKTPAMEVNFVVDE